MQSIQKYVSITLLTLTLTVPMSPSAQAHLMEAQHGTLNIIDDGAFMVLSLPISAFMEVDDDNDGKVSMLEFNNHRATIVEAVRQHVTLSDKNGNRPLQGIMLSPVVSHDAPKEPTLQLTVMGKFTLENGNSALRFHIGLYGKQTAEQSLEITAIRKSDNQKHVFELMPTASTGMLFPDKVYSPD